MTTTSTRTVSFTTTVVSVQDNVAKRQAGTDPTPAPLAGYPADYVTSGCSLAITSPDALTTTTTATLTQVRTDRRVIATAVGVTSTAVATVLKHPLVNGGFETGSFTPWVPRAQVDENPGTVVSWTLEPGEDAARGAYVAQVSVLNLNPNIGTFATWMLQNFIAYPGQSYTLTYDYRCTVVNAAYTINSDFSGVFSQFTCDSADTWY